MTSYNRLPLALVALILFFATSANGARVPTKPPGAEGNANFPYVADSWSPDARFVLKNVNTPQAATPHSIFLTDMKTGERTILYAYERRADVLWSPASDALAINDWRGNGDSECLVFPLDPHAKRIDLREAFLKSQRPEREKELAADRADYARNYAHVLRWLDPRTLLFAVQGYSSDGQRRFLLVYRYTLGESFRLIQRAVR